MPKNFHRSKIGQKFLYPAIFWTLKNILDDLVIFDTFWVYFDIFLSYHSFSGRKFRAFSPKIFFRLKYAQKFPSLKNWPKIFVSGHILDLKNFGWFGNFWHFLGIFWFFWACDPFFWPKISCVLSENFLLAKICPKISIASKSARKFCIRPYFGPWKFWRIWWFLNFFGYILFFLGLVTLFFWPKISRVLSENFFPAKIYARI